MVSNSYPKITQFPEEKQQRNVGGHWLGKDFLDKT